MCGISVLISLGPSNGLNKPKTHDVEAIKGQLDRSLDLIAHRGPDSKGIWVTNDGSVGLGHCRLSIEDLSDAGNQPLHSDDGGVHAVINGEIYDHERIRKELEQNHGYHFKGRSDSEVVVALYIVYGAPAFFDHLRGEFSLVVYDQRQGRIIATRDRFGIKPLFWTIIDEEDKRVLLFATEMKAFLAMGWKPKWDVQSVFQAGWVIDDRSLFKGVKKLTPGYWMEITLPEGQLRRHLYWDSDYNDKRQVECRTVEEMIEGVREKLIEAIRLRLRADVPVGIYLSGGIDSSLIAGIVARLVREENATLGSKKGQVTCFSIEFPNSPLDEFDVAKRTADWLGVDIVKCKADEAALAENFENSVYHCEYQTFDLGPTGKTILSSIPREAGFKVVLTGEGSDEHFAGYPFTPRDFLLEPDLSWPASILVQDTERLDQMQQEAVELFDRQAAALGVKGDKFGWDETYPAYHQANRVNMPNAVLGMSGATFPMWAPWVVEKWSGLDLREAVIRAMSPAAREKILNQWHPLHTSLYITTKTFLCNYLLVSLGDRTEMAHSIEARPPFLDHDLVEYVNRLPPSLKLRCTSDLNSSTDQQEQEPQLIEKWILREAGKPFIPEEIYKRKKQPYLAPVKWPQNGPLHQMFQRLCTKEATENLGFVSWAPVERALQHAFGPDGEQGLFRLLVCVAGWVVLSQRLGVEKATEAEWADSPLYDPWCDF